MKKYAYVLLFAAFYSTAQPGCLTDRDGIRSVPFQEVDCACPCDRYNHDPRRNMCVKCGHYNIDNRYSFDNLPNTWNRYEDRYNDGTKATKLGEFNSNFDSRW